MRRAANSISALRDSEGELQTSMDGISDIVVEFFEDLFATSYPHAMDNVLDYVAPRVTETMNDSLCAPLSRAKVDYAFHQMHPHKVPGPDGMNPLFFQKIWDIIGDDVSAAVLDSKWPLHSPLDESYSYGSHLEKVKA